MGYLSKKVCSGLALFAGDLTSPVSSKWVNPVKLIPFPLPVTVQNSRDCFRNGQMPSSGSMILWGSLLGTSGNSFLPSWENHRRDFYILLPGTAAASCGWRQDELRKLRGNGASRATRFSHSWNHFTSWLPIMRAYTLVFFRPAWIVSCDL